jgi:hypothetical protein
LETPWATHNKYAMGNIGKGQKKWRALLASNSNFFYKTEVQRVKYECEEYGLRVEIKNKG